MANETYAYIKNDTVVNVAVFDNPADELLEFFIKEYDIDKIILATTKTAIGGTFDGTKFWLPKPYESWIKNEDLEEWQAPVSYPLFDEQNPKYYIWNEEILNWEEVLENEGVSE
jgi:hypothetical protein